MMLSGYSNYIFVESNKIKQYYVSRGITINKIKVTGGIVDDEIYRIKKKKKYYLSMLKKELGIKSNKPILLIGGCTDQSQNCPYGGFDFNDFKEFADFFQNNLKKMVHNFEIIFRPHPNFNMFKENQDFIKKTNIDIVKLIPLCDLYISFASATIRWSILSSVPTINYDVFNYKFDDYNNVNGLINIDNKVDFKKKLDLINKNLKFLKKQHFLLKESALEFGRDDGKSSETIINEINKIIRND